MTTEQQQVRDFMKKFQQKVEDAPTQASYEVRKIRAELILEEAMETIAALGFEVGNKRDEFDPLDMNLNLQLAPHNAGPFSLAEIADGLGDLHYVAYCGTGLALGIDMEPVFAEIHRSNMSKLWTQEDIQKSYDGQGWGKITEQDGKYLLTDVRGKVLKSPSYSPAKFPWLP